MRMDSSPSRNRRLFPWAVLFVGIVSVPIIFTSASAVSQPHWDWDTSFFGRFIASPLLVVGLCGCVAASFFTRLTLGWRVALSVGALAAFVGAIAISYVLCIMFFGAPFH